MSPLAAAVEQAVDGLRRAFPESAVAVDPDGAGGAFVVIDPVPVGPRYQPDSSWLGFHLAPTLPDADVYPLYLDAGLRRSDGQPPRDQAIQQVNWRGRVALQLSRRSNGRNPGVDTPAVKAVNVLAWFQKL